MVMMGNLEGHVDEEPEFECNPVVGDGEGVLDPVGDGEGVFDPVGDGEGVFDPVGEGEGVLDPLGDGEGEGKVQVMQVGGRLTVLVSRVTAAFMESALPVRLTDCSKVMAVPAMMVPTKIVPAPRVAPVLTAQKTLHAWAEPLRTTRLPAAVIRV